jgi:hydroxymethylpyrimidine pyrophosphatase-like HAD family hydrolase
MTQISKPLNKVLLMDLDKTIIGSDQQVNDNRLVPTINLARVSEWKIGLSSDTPLSTLIGFTRNFSMDDIIIAEKGAIVRIGGKVIYTKPETVEMFSKSFDVAVDRIGNINMKVVKGTPVPIMFRREIFGKPFEPVVFVNSERKSSFGLFVLKTDETGRLVTNREDSEKVFKAVEDVMPVSPSIQKWSSSERGLMVVSDSDISKRSGTILLMKEMGLKEVGMVGDSIIDYVGNIAKHYAVGNADENFRAKADYVSPFELTSGVVDIIAGLLRDA